VHQAIAEEAQINAMMRNRSIGPDAASYNKLDGLNEIHGAYSYKNQYIDSERQRLLAPETNQRIAEAILADMQSIIAERAVIS
jgi:hypothetical protein